MLQIAGNLRLGDKPIATDRVFRVPGLNLLERDPAMQLGVLGQEDLSQPPFGMSPENLIARCRLLTGAGPETSSANNSTRRLSTLVVRRPGASAIDDGVDEACFPRRSNCFAPRGPRASVRVRVLHPILHRARQLGAIDESHLEGDQAEKQVAIDGLAGHFIT